MSERRRYFELTTQELASGFHNAPRPSNEKDGNLIGSILKSDTGPHEHLPVLDIDFEARLVPSSTPGHYHLYLDGMKPLSQVAYTKLLLALAEAGIISQGYLNHSLRRGYTAVRKPGVAKSAAETATSS